jgi:hypothetical protein
MTISKQFAHDSTALDNYSDQLVEALVKLLEASQPSPADEAIGDLHSTANRAINVTVRKSKEQRQDRSCR